MAKRVTWNGQTINLPDNLSNEEAQASLSTMFPELANYSYEEDAEGNLHFAKNTGTKG